MASATRLWESGNGGAATADTGDFGGGGDFGDDGGAATAGSDNNVTPESEALANWINEAIAGTAQQLGRPLTNQEKLKITDAVKEAHGVESHFSEDDLPSPTWEALKAFVVNALMRSSLTDQDRAFAQQFASKWTDYNPADSLENSAADAASGAANVAGDVISAAAPGLFGTFGPGVILVAAGVLVWFIAKRT